jgi:hypothetical protein
MVDVNAYAIVTARTLRQEIRDVQKCPNTIESWETDTREVFRRFGKQGFYLGFDCHEDLSFVIWIKYDMDSGTHITGAPNKPIEVRYGHFTDSKVVAVQDTDDARLVAEYVVREQ